MHTFSILDVMQCRVGRTQDETNELLNLLQSLKIAGAVADETTPAAAAAAAAAATGAPATAAPVIGQDADINDIAMLEGPLGPSAL